MATTVTLYDRDGNSFDFAASDFAQRGHQESVTAFGVTDQRFIISLLGNALNTSAAFIANSTDSLTIGTGTKNLTVEKNKPFFPDLSARIQEDGNPSNFMDGGVNSYDPNTGALEINVTSTGGSGTFSDWKVLCAGLQGAKGDPGDTRWTLEAEIDLSAQGSAFTVSGLPTSKRRLQLEFSQVTHSGTGTVDLEAQISTDGGSTFLTATNYTSKGLNTGVSGSSTAGNDRFIVSQGLSVFSNSGYNFAFAGELTFLDFNNTDGKVPYINGIVSHGNKETVLLSLTYDAIPSSKIDAIKVMLESHTFATGTLRVWSA